MKIAGIIPARYDSTRFPGKPLTEINGKSMIRRVYEQALKSKLMDIVVVATDNKKIFDHVSSFGGEVMMTSAKHKTGTDRINEALKNIKCGIVVNIQGDEPFIDSGNIDKAIAPLLSEKDLNVSTLAIKIKNNSDITDPNVVKVIFDINNYAIYFSRGILPHVRENPGSIKSGLSSVKYYKHIGLYVYRKSFLNDFVKMKKSYLEEAEKLEQLRILENGEKIKVIETKKDSHSVDTPKDLLQFVKSPVKRRS
ncbi:MAG TPA: 3-deoxy-manno-octulosonate cytidylyltransferase [Ignavibacteria bacterium]|nr:3-deoxy-manno-octulosonate cytidylyltransferase [Bacteroidota bacterium]HRI86133.1 3-deoxy-manno-octulosonate cytidylyltransferase [Ignavibacteria bacterium]HRJ98391.1 3-deoxy-manno-octulosonate cytidylyltransferase [Ignavibacteria bacterium]